MPIFNEADLTTISWLCYFLAMMSFIGLLVAQATQLSRRRALAREAELGAEVEMVPGLVPAMAGANLGGATLTLNSGAVSRAATRATTLDPAPTDSAADVLPMAGPAR